MAAVSIPVVSSSCCWGVSTSVPPSACFVSRLLSPRFRLLLRGRRFRGEFRTLFFRTSPARKEFPTFPTVLVSISGGFTFFFRTPVVVAPFVAVPVVALVWAQGSKNCSFVNLFVLFFVLSLCLSFVLHGISHCVQREIPFLFARHFLLSAQIVTALSPVVPRLRSFPVVPFIMPLGRAGFCPRCANACRDCDHIKSHRAI